jgi:uncharacterized membrane protein
VKRFLHSLRDTFISGLLAIIPVGATFYILFVLYHLIDGLVGRETPFGTMVKTALGRWIPGMGIYMTVILVLLVGFITRNFLGRALQYYMDRAFSSVPGVRKMYSTLKQFTTALLDRDTSSFQKVVMFEYPKEGINVIGLVTNEELGMLQDTTGAECLLVYVPTAPNPLSGMMLIIPEREVTYLDMPVEDALSMVISSGSVLPESLKTVNKEEKRPRFSLFRRR